MRAYSPSKEVHRTLSVLFKPWFQERGWKKRPGSSCAFLRPRTDAPGFWCCWFQVSQWGNSWSGNSFTLNVVPQQDAKEPLAGGPGARVLATMSDADRKLGMEVEARVKARIPNPAADHQIYEWMKLPGAQGEMFRRSFHLTFNVNPAAWEPGVDVWLYYFAADDLEEWFTFLTPRLEALIRSETRELD
jgi:hypothetical protein